MKRLYILIVCQLFFFSAFPQWTRLPSPVGQIKIQNILECGDQVFLFTAYGIYAKKEGEQRWSFKSPEFVKYARYRSDTIFMIYRTYYLAFVDLQKQPFTIEEAEEAYTYDPQDLECTENEIFIASNMEGFKVYYDVNRPGSCARFNEGLPNSYVDGYPVKYVRSIILKSDTVLIQTENGSRFKSKIGEYEWEAAMYNEFLMDGTSYYLDYTTKIGDSIYLARGGSSIELSKNNGRSWSEIGFPGFEYSNLTCMGGIGNEIYCGTKSNGVYIFNDSIWIPNNEGIEAFQATQIVEYDEGLFVSTGDSVYDYNYRWNYWNNITPTNISGKVVWDKMVKLPDRLVITSIPEGYNNYRGWNLHIQQYDGTWIERTTPFDNEARVRSRSFFSNRYRIYMEVEQLCFTDDLGQSWKYTTGGYNANHWHTMIVDTIFSSREHDVYRYDPVIATWRFVIKVQNILASSGVTCERPLISYFCSVNNYLFIRITNWSPNYSLGWFRSSDSGHTWEQVNNGLEDVISKNSYVHSHEIKDSLLILGMRSGQALITTDYGDHWKILEYPEIGAGDYGIYGPLALYSDTLYLSVNQGGAEGFPGIWKYPVKDLAVSTNPKEIVESDFQMYPNPTRGIIYLGDLSHPADIKVISLEGKLLKSESGVRDQIDISDLPDGIYLLKMSIYAKTVLERAIIKVSY